MMVLVSMSPARRSRQVQTNQFPKFGHFGSRPFNFSEIQI